MPSLSVIIPTHKRASILRQCIDHIEKQTIKDDLEVIVVSDGHDDETSQLFESTMWEVPVQFFEIEKSQQGVARNRGVEQAQSPLCLFIGDDIFLQEDACEKHVKAHNHIHETMQEGAVLGFTTWDPAVGITSVMKWLEQSGWQFGYSKIAGYKEAFLPPESQHLFTYTSNISLPTVHARNLPFREDTTLYGWEDIEWGKRLRKSDIRIFYQPYARAFHHHHIELDESLSRMRTLGTSAVQMKQSLPDFDRVPEGSKLLAYKLAALLPTYAGKHRRAFLEGIENATKK